MTELYTKLIAHLRAERGQTMAEYAIVLAVITVGIIVALTALGTGISDALDGVTSKLSP